MSTFGISSIHINALLAKIVTARKENNWFFGRYHNCSTGVAYIIFKLHFHFFLYIFIIDVFFTTLIEFVNQFNSILIGIIVKRIILDRCGSFSEGMGIVVRELGHPLFPFLIMFLEFFFVLALHYLLS